MDTKHLVSGLVVFVVSVVAYVVLTLKGADTAGLVTLVGPLLAGAAAVTAVNKRSDDQDKTLSTIAENVNGKLDKRIQDGVRAVLDERS